jgi:hypothetical protein
MWSIIIDMTASFEWHFNVFLLISLLSLLHISCQTSWNVEILRDNTKIIYLPIGLVNTYSRIIQFLFTAYSLLGSLIIYLVIHDKHLCAGDVWPICE